MQKQRLDWVDALKGVAIVAIILGHTHVPFRAYLFSFHIPLFLAVSGFLFDEDRYTGPWDFLQRKARALLVPYAFLSFVSFVAAYLVDGRGYPVLQSVREVLVSTRGHISMNPTLWYLTCLFVVETLFYFLAKMVKSDYLKALVVLPIAAIGYSTYQDPLLPFSADAALYFLLFLFIGYLWRRHTPTKYVAVLGTVCAVAVGLLITRPEVYQQATAWSTRWYLLGFAVSVGFALLGILGCWRLGMLLQGSRTVRSWGVDSLGIFALHVFVLDGVYYLIVALGLHVNQASIPYALFVAVVSMVTTRVIAEGLRRNLPSVMGAGSRRTSPAADPSEAVA